MKSKNNCIFTNKFESKQRFGFRKLSIGLVAAALGTTFMITDAQVTHADETNPSTQASEQSKQETTTSTTSTDSASQVVKGKSNNLTLAAQDQNNHQTQDATVDSKSAKETNVDVYATSSDNEGNDTNNLLTDNQVTDIMAGQDNIYIHTDITNLQANDKKIKFNFNDTKNDLVINTEDNFQTNINGWMVTKDTPDSVIAEWTNTNLNPSSLSLSIPVIGKVTNSSTTLDANNPTQASLTITIGDNAPIVKDLFKADVLPYEDKVVEDEIIKGFSMGQKDFNSEVGYGNISQEDIDKYNLNEETKLLQWGIYFNYGQGIKLNPLENAHFDALFHGDQTFLPGSIKVWQVPDNLIVNTDGERYGIDDTVSYNGQDTKVYEVITEDGNYRPNFVKYLQVNSNNATAPNGFAVDQRKSNENVTFYIPVNGQNDTNFSKHAYFIQVDTALPKDQTNPGNGAYMIYQSFQGQGTTPESHIAFLNKNITGSGTGTDILYDQEAQLRFYDDTTNTWIETSDPYVVDTKGLFNETINFGEKAQNLYDQLINKHYLLVNVQKANSATDKGQSILSDKFNTNYIYGSFDNTDNSQDPTKDAQPQFFVVHFKHDIQKGSEEKTINEIIDYIDAETKKSIAPSYKSATLAFTRTKDTDLVTNEVKYGKWSISSLKSVENPKIDGYTIDAKDITEQLNGTDSKLLATNEKEVGGILFTEDQINGLPKASTIAVVVPYNKVPDTPNIPNVPVIPSEPTQPDQPTVPDQPSIPSKPQQPTEPGTVRPHSTNVPKNKNLKHSRKQNSKNYGHGNSSKLVNTDYKVPNNQTTNPLKESKESLPNTGVKDNKLGLIGLAFASLAGIFGIAGSKRKHD